MTRAPGVTGLTGAAAVELDYLRRHLRRARGFSLALVVSNHESLTLAVARDIVADGGVVVDLDAGGPGLVSQIEHALQGRDASRVVLLGLARLLDDPQSPALRTLNLNRDYLATLLDCPLVVVAPSWVIRWIARDAADLWSVRSTVVEFAADPATAASSLADAGRMSWETSPAVRRERARLLAAMAAERAESGCVPTAYDAELLTARARAASLAGRTDRAEDLLGQALPLYRTLGNRRGEANTLKSLGDTALARDNYARAEDLLGQALPLYRTLGNRRGEANTLHSLARVRAAQGDAERARADYEAAASLADPIDPTLAAHLTAEAERLPGGNR